MKNFHRVLAFAVSLFLANSSFAQADDICVPNCVENLNASIVWVDSVEAWKGIAHWNSILTNRDDEETGCFGYDFDFVIRTVGNARRVVGSGKSDDAGNEEYSVAMAFIACEFLDDGLIVEISSDGGTCETLVTFTLDGTPALAQGRSKDVYCTDPLVEGGDINDEPPTALFPCETERTPMTFVADWIVAKDCDASNPGVVNDTSKIIYREYEAMTKEGTRTTVFDTITVFNFPEIVPDLSNVYCVEKDTTYCGVGDPGPFLLIPERCDPGVLGVDFDEDGSLCDTVYFLLYDTVMQMYVQNPVFEDKKCGLLVHLDKWEFGDDGCEKLTKYQLNIKQSCPGSISTFCAMTPTAIERVADGYYLCEFWNVDLDTLAPVVECKEKWAIASTGPHECAAHAYVPPVNASDAWSGIKSVKARIVGIGSAILEYNPTEKCYETHQLFKLPISHDPYQVIYEAFDSCHNVGRDTCYIKVKDLTSPVVSVDKGVTVSLSGKKVWADAESFNEGSYDNCGINLILARRSDWQEACVDLCRNPKDAECGDHDPSTEQAYSPCYIGPHHDTLWTIDLENDKHCDEVEAHYAKQLLWFCEDGIACGELLYNAWQYDLMKYATLQCQQHPYEVDDHYFEDLLKNALADPAFAEKWKVAVDPYADTLHVIHDKSELVDQMDEWKQLGGGWSDQVPFDCSDACSQVTIEVLAIDYWCNWSTAWLDVWVEDKTPVEVAKDVLDIDGLSCKTYRSKRYTYADEAHPVSLEYIIEQGKAGEEEAFNQLDDIFGGYCKAWRDDHGNYVDEDWEEIECDISFSDSACYCRDSLVKFRTYDEHYGYVWQDSLITYCDYAVEKRTFQKGIVVGNCAENIFCDQEVWCEFDHCGAGYIFRKFKIWQGCSPESDIHSPHVPDTIVRHQRIQIGNYCPLNKYMFDVPDDTEVIACGVEYDPDGSGNIVGAAGPENTGEAKYIFDDDCRIVGVGHQDKVFNIVGGDEGCYKIIRTWYFADWCTYGIPASENFDAILNTPNVFSCEQKILVFDTIPPVCIISSNNSIEGGEGSAENPAALVANGGCLLTFDGVVNITDACGLINVDWELKDIKAGSATITKNGSGELEGNDVDFPLAISDVVPGKYKLQVQIRDQCQNESFCEYYFDVIASKKPGPVCVTSLTAELQPWDTNQDNVIDSAVAVIWADEFESSSLPPCGEDYSSLHFYIEWAAEASDSFDLDRVADSLVVTCSRMQDEMARLWVTSESGTADYCDVLVVVQDNNDACANSDQMGNVSGKFMNVHRTPIERVTIDVEAAGTVNEILDGSEGSYQYRVELGTVVTVDPRKNDDHVNGVSTLDIIAVVDYLSGEKVFTDPADRLAADVNQDQQINSLDVDEIRALVMAEQDEFAQVNSWKFILQNYTFSSDTPEQENAPQRLTLAVSDREMYENFLAIKMGDVNHDHDPTAGASRSASSVVLVTDDRFIERGEEYVIEFTAKDWKNIDGYQFTLDLDEQTLAFVDIEMESALNLDERYFGKRHLASGALTTSWNSPDAQSLKDGEKVFAVRLKALRNGRLADALSINSRITKAEAYHNNVVSPVALQLTPIPLGDEAILFQNYPNPVEESTTISFYLPKQQHATVSISDVLGRVVQTYSAEYSAGINSIDLSRAVVPVPGVWNITLTSAGNQWSKSMLVH